MQFSSLSCARADYGELALEAADGTVRGLAARESVVARIRQTRADGRPARLHRSDLEVELGERDVDRFQFIDGGSVAPLHCGDAHALGLLLRAAAADLQLAAKLDATRPERSELAT